MNIKNEYKKSWKYLKESKNYFWIISGIFLFFIFVGFVFPVFFVDEIFEVLKNLINQTENLSGLGLILFIIFNNIGTSFIGIILGFFLGIVPIFVSLVNGYVLGFVARLAVEEGGFGVLWSLAPHGVFEIPALIISLGIGLKIGKSVLDVFVFAVKDLFKIKYKKKSLEGNIKNNLVGGLRVFVLVVVPLLIIAGIIEGLLISFLG